MDYSAIAKKLTEKNPALTKLVEDNQGDNYKLVREQLTGPLLSKIGQAEGGYVKAHELTWAIINTVEGNEDIGLDY